MAREHLRHIDISDVPALVHLAEEVRLTNRPTVLCRGPEAIVVLVPSRGARTKRQVPPLADPDDIWAGYDPLQVQHALAESAGAFRDLDTDALLADLAAQRQQDSSGRPGDA